MSPKACIGLAAKSQSHIFSRSLEESNIHMIQKIGTMTILLNIISLHCFCSMSADPAIRELGGTCVTTYSGNQTLAISHLE